MLTKSDLSQIQKVVQEETKKIVQSETRKIVQSETRRIVQEELIPVKKAIGAVDKKLDKAQEDISEILTALDERQTKFETRLDRLEEHVEIPKPS